MKRTFVLSIAAALLCGMSSFAARADVITITFEGIPDFAPIGNFYSGLGIEFSPATLALVDADAGGNGNFANEPSPSTIMFFLDANNAILNYAAGFTDGFSFFYSSSTAASVNVYDGINGTGNLLGSLALAAQGFNNCVGDPTGSFCNWSAIGVAFGGTARSIDFGGTANQTGFDNITFGSATPGDGTTVPEPGTVALLGLGLLGVGLIRRRRGLS